MDAAEAVVRSTCATALDRYPDLQAIVVVALGDEVLRLAFGTRAEPAQVGLLTLGVAALADRFFGRDPVSELALEQAIAEVEECVMPWQRKLPPAARLFCADADVIDIARRAGMPEDADTCVLATDQVERLFNRWLASVQGRPSRQDPLPRTSRFSARLLVLRECLHHLGFDRITILKRAPNPDPVFNPAA